MSVGTKKVTTSGTGAVIAETVSDLVDGALHGAQGKTSIAATVGDIAASCVPGIGEAKALRDVFDGLKSGDVGRTIGGIVGLIPVAGGAANAGSKAIQQIGKEATEKGLSVAALQFSRAAAASAKQTINSPAFKKQLGEAGERAFQRATHLLTERLQTMAAKGEAPDITARDHQSWGDARDAAF